MSEPERTGGLPASRPAGRTSGVGRGSGAWRALVPAIALLAGMLFATSAETAQGTDLRAGRRIELTQLITAEERSVGDATRQVVRLQGEVDALERQASVEDGRVGSVRAESGRLEGYVGLRPITGRGLTVILDDAPRRPDGSLPPDARPDDVIVHQQDVQSVVNALWAGGADGLTVMDQRLITTGAVRCVGNTLLLYGRTYSPPFRITAIGDPDRLRGRLEIEPGVRLYRQAVGYFGLGYEVKDEREVTLPGYDGPLRLSYAEAVPR
ncbi:MAG TPA: DUF881 domain-containing protein [Mycobacteriales bacterium]|jgi:uncharacterized protein YlxW (UPF0749 family)|nr:DUF881 domain-containing protein [Mycobacteriales bacterium]